MSEWFKAVVSKTIVIFYKAPGVQSPVSLSLYMYKMSDVDPRVTGI